MKLEVSQHLLGGTYENYKNRSQVSLSVGRDSNRDFLADYLSAMFGARTLGQRRSERPK